MTLQMQQAVAGAWSEIEELIGCTMCVEGNRGVAENGGRLLEGLGWFIIAIIASPAGNNSPTLPATAAGVSS